MSTIEPQGSAAGAVEQKQERRVRRRSRRIHKPEGEVEDLQIPDDPLGREYNAKNYYTKLILGAVIGIVTGFFFGIDSALGLGFMQFVWFVFLAVAWLLSIGAIRLYFRIDAQKFSNRRLLLSGTVSLIMMWVLVSVLVWSFMLWILQGFRPITL
jgi:multisubunit Na+/H+ antiporter MnhB subunit